ncbi:RNA polymerase sigma factor [Adlercreutzia sp. ZJ473]|uniref:RNA polymerase sigma factor n=1 Tax=Adlercreutzia sp. ZJ473 TaxID=2722822 RepID=UPI0015549312|nr:sigma-70 family RNA polymerase sigma factor [Adlercreutzia sp. ZJ473]
MSLPRKNRIDLDDVEAALERWGDTVYRLAVCRLRNRADAQDAFQDVFLALVRTRPAFSSREHQKAWLLRTCCNCCNDIARKRMRHAAEALDDLDVIDPAAEHVSDPALTRALEALTDRQRTAVHLRYFEGYSAEEIARITGEKPATVRSHLFRARNTLKIKLTSGEELPCMSENSNTATTSCKRA